MQANKGRIIKKTEYINDEDLVRLAGKYSYKNLKLFDRLILNRKQFEVINIRSNKKTGLNAITVLNLKSKEYAVIYQGTQAQKDGGIDLFADASLVTTHTSHPQFEDAYQYLVEMKKKFPNLNYVAGNSLGGDLSNYVAKRTRNEYPKLKSVTLNPAMLPEDVLNPSQGMKDDRITNYLTNRDPLTKAQMSNGFGNRIPGKNIYLDFQITSGLGIGEMLSKNHTGYVEKDYLVVDGVKIETAADLAIATNIWTGESLQATGVDRKEKIIINHENIQILVDALEDRVLTAIHNADQYLSHSIKTVQEQGSRLDDRQETLKLQFDEVINSIPLLSIFMKWINGENTTLDVMKKLNPVWMMISQRVNEILHHPLVQAVISETTKIISMFSIIQAIPGYIVIIENIIYQINKFLDRVVNDEIPKLFRGIDNHYFDGVVDELIAHYKIIKSNKNIIVKQVGNFQSATKSVSAVFGKLDRQLADNIAQGKVNTIDTGDAVIAPADHHKCITSDLLIDKMGIKKRQLALNYKNFAQNVAVSISPLLEALVNAIDQLHSKLTELLSSTLNVAMVMVLIPESILIKIGIHKSGGLKNMQSEIKDLLDQLSEFKNVARKANNNMDSLFLEFESYVDTALFHGTKYENVISLNYSALTLLNKMSLQFENISYQLMGNKADIIERLQKQAAKIKNNIDILNEQVERGTVTP
ncbi:hypothetical protein A374_02214 [Fictibacillus macauensis ZFHKF-1]|uniref:Uncharacterized protein n=1 Tax=Fictibacillus macauensis ZFHKF-1 TaxID=1196324 RepID=I8UJI4_9BACL|nr:DUF2974 domain-containing protein [Fictibacillus macauensis]EIT87030.1 hypothetical protein A374_02214 [Fictibacillus macauensis ZFHKF-1]